MSVLPKEIIKVFAESAGFPGLSDDIAGTLAPDVEYRIRTIVQEALKFRNHAKRKTLLPEDVNASLRQLNVEPVLGYLAPDPPKFKPVPQAPGTFALDDKIIDLPDIINQTLPKCPLDVSLASHWLAIEGVQPAIAQNPAPVAAEGPTKMKKRKQETGESLGGTHTTIKQKVEHHVSKELQLFYEKVTTAVKGSEEGLRNKVIASLAEDPGLTQLVPYFVQFISEEVAHNLKSLPVLTSLMQMTRALLISEHLHIEPYLHQLMPAILTCVVGKQLCTDATENHWELREYAAGLVALVCKEYGNAYTDMQSRIVQTLTKAFLDPQRPLTTHFGAFVALNALGRNFVRLLLLPHLKTYHALLAPALTSLKISKKHEANMVNSLLLKIVGQYIAQSLQDLRKSRHHPHQSLSSTSSSNTLTSSSSVPSAVPTPTSAMPVVTKTETTDGVTPNDTSSAASGGVVGETVEQTTAAIKLRQELEAELLKNLESEIPLSQSDLISMFGEPINAYFTQGFGSSVNGGGMSGSRSITPTPNSAGASLAFLSPSRSSHATPMQM